MQVIAWVAPNAEWRVLWGYLALLGESWAFNRQDVTHRNLSNKTKLSRFYWYQNPLKGVIVIPFASG